MVRSKAACFACLTLLCALCGCDKEQTITDQFKPLPSSGWDARNTLSFPVDSIGRSGDYRLGVNVRTTRDIPFQSISVVVEQRFENPRYQSRDTVEVMLADNRGNLEGRGLYLYTTGTETPHQLHLYKGQHGVIRLSHIMRRNLLSGIRDVGISISK